MLVQKYARKKSCQENCSISKRENFGDQIMCIKLLLQAQYVNIVPIIMTIVTDDSVEAIILIHIIL